MSGARQQHAAELVTVRKEMNAHGAMTVEAVDSNATRHIAEYETSQLQSTLQQLPAGASVPLELRPVGTRGNVWRATALARPRQ
ncbi:hypothetical protein AUR64_13715 [Haloprofundus marisrubri]|uniref:DUF7999 domain-containing protein n=1 Tax=Haloprofundus marisrubri TaxID=1514971 RepID=A0A0W1R5Y4_9EURY|nr:hypothetical protein [Haloprofundus marisrubri]KTG08867.1 hypothetical protein AUR64_13715 [Haloprofundus marisrubri]